MTVSSEPTCRLEAVGSKPMYAVTRSLSNRSRKPSVDSETNPRHCNSSKRLAMTAVDNYIRHALSCSGDGRDDAPDGFENAARERCRRGDRHGRVRILLRPS